VALPPVNFPTLGWQVIDWIETFLCHGPGDVQGAPISIDDELALHICWLYRIHPHGHPLAGRRLIQRAVLSRPKGRSKSEIAGMLVCGEALGPVRCDGFDAAGEPVGVPVTYPFIRCLATEEDQAGNTYDNVRYMLENGQAADEFAVDVGLTRTFIKEPGGGEIVPSTSGSASKDGGKETFSVADETHLYVSRELRTMYRTVARNTGKRKLAEPWLYDTTTMFAPGEHSIAEQAAERYRGMPADEAVLRHGVLYDHVQGSEPKRFGDDRSLIKAMRPGYGPAAEWIDFDRIVKVIRDSEDPEGEAYRYFLNIERKSSASWLAPDDIAAVLDADLEPEPGAKVTLGFDGSENDDHTALWLCTQDGDLVPVGIWTPDGEDLAWREDVHAAVDWCFDTFEIVRFELDPPYWQHEAGVWASRHSNPRTPSTLPVVEFWTNQDAKMAVACGALRTAIRQKAIRIQPAPLRTEAQTRAGKPLAVWHFENARTRKVRVRLEDRAEEAHIVRKDRPGSPHKIDSVPAAVLARHARDMAVKAGEFETRTYGRAQFGGLF
jgi:hypothetical protein